MVAIMVIIAVIMVIIVVIMVSLFPDVAQLDNRILISGKERQIGNSGEKKIFFHAKYTHIRPCSYIQNIDNASLCCVDNIHLARWNTNMEDCKIIRTSSLELQIDARTCKYKQSK